MREQKVYTFELFEKQRCILFYKYITMWIAKFFFLLKLTKEADCSYFNTYVLTYEAFIYEKMF